MSDRLQRGIKGTKARPGVSSRLCSPPARGEGTRLPHWVTWDSPGQGGTSIAWVRGWFPDLGPAAPASMGGGSQHSCVTALTGRGCEVKGGINGSKGMPDEMFQLKALSPVPSARPQRREPQHKTSTAGRPWQCRTLSWEQEMPKSGFGPRTAALYVGGVVPATGKGLQGPPILKSPSRSLGCSGASHSTPQSCRALARKNSLCSLLLLSQRGCGSPGQRAARGTCLSLAHTATQHLPAGMSSPLLPGTG